MAFSEFEIKKHEKEIGAFLDGIRPPAHIRKELDFGFHIENQSVILFELRPEWRNPENVIELPFAKASYVKTQKIWKIYWQRQDLKWHQYEPVAEVKSLASFLSVVKADEFSCFFG